MDKLTPEQEKRQIAAALRRLNRLQLNEAFDSARPTSKPSDVQLQILKDINNFKHRYIRAGNQCLVKGTLIATPSGPICIEDILPGDIIYSEYGTPIKVKDVFSNGIKEVADITYRGKTWASCTGDHIWLIQDDDGRKKEIKAKDFTKNKYICRNIVKSNLGSIREPHAYAIGALLGDGCSKEKRKGKISISSIDSLIPQKVSQILGGGEVKRQHQTNYTWIIDTDKCNYYDNWCKDRYAHEKIVDLDIIKTWDRESLLNFVAGLIDTDGSIHPGRDFIHLSLSMQAESVVIAFQYACLALWNIPLNIKKDIRPKYKNGPVHIAYSNNATYIRYILEELDPYLMSPQKKWRDTYLTLGGRRCNLEHISAVWGKNKRLEQTYDIHVDSPTNLYLLANGLVTHNSGKSSIGAREVAWIFEDNHPYWERPKEWENESLLLIVVGRLGNQIENSLWPKIKGFLDPGTYKEQRSGSALQRVINTKNGNVILFASHHSENEAREKLQSYVAHYAWLDEMPGNSGIIEELHRRVQARNGYFLATFTPKVKNEDIRRFVDSQVPPLAQTYRLQMFDNPLYSPERQEEILASLQGKGTSEKNAILYGDWMEDDNTVYQLNRDSTVVTSLPTSYSPGWRHVESVDPALKSKFGFLLLAEDPATAKWYVVQSSYISGVFVPEHMIAEVRKKAAGYNIVRRISDNEPWFVNSAVHQQLKPAYMQVFNKTQRKGDLIKNLQTALGTKIFIPIWNEDLILELESARWKETSETIQNSQDMHLSDALQYAVDILPPPVFTPEARPYHQILRDNHEKAYIQKVVDEKTKANKLPSHVKQFKIKKVGTRWK